MYLRAVHADFDVKGVYLFIRNNPLGTLITAIECPGQPFIQCTNLPWVLETEGKARLKGHLARANPHSKSLIHGTERDVTVLFNSPVQSYVTPSFYTYKKPQSGKVAPTWNYSSVQITGRARIYHEGPETMSYLQSQVEQLTRENEARRGGTWEVSDAPKEYIDALKRAIIGVEVEITLIEGKNKMSQELADGDRQGVIDGFRQMGTELGDAVADVVEERQAVKSERAGSR